MIGAIKSGSTALAAHIDAFDGLYIGRPKEPQFFSGGRYAHLGRDAYLALYESAPDHVLCGDASTCYSRYPHHGDIASSIATQCPNANFLYPLRNPAGRVYSHYLHEMLNQWFTWKIPPQAFSHVWRSNPEYIDTSDYMYQLEQYLKHYSRDRILLCTTDDLARDPASLVDRTCSFLRVPVASPHPPQSIRANKSLATASWRVPLAAHSHASSTL